MQIEKLRNEVAEAGDIHSDECCTRSDYGCDVDVEILDCCDNMKFINNILTKAVEEGRISVLEDFDMLTKADAYVGFGSYEWAAIKKFFQMNKVISGWDKK